LKKEAKLLHSRAVDSLVMGVDHFNRCWDRGRTEAVLIFLDRAFELLLKAIIVERGGSIRDKRDSTRTITHDSCLRLCFSDAKVRCLSDEDVMSLQNLNSLRDAAQHYIVEPSEGQLYVYAQSAVTTFKRLAADTLGLSIIGDVPDRMVVVSARPPKDFGALLDLDFDDIKKMAAPGSRRRLDAHARLRSIAVLERSLEGERAQPTAGQLDKVLKRINGGEVWRDIFPGVATIYIDPENGAGIGITLRISRNDGEAVRLVSEGATGAAVVAVRRVNELSYYSLGFTDILEKLKAKDSRVGFNKLVYLINREGLRDDLDYAKMISIGGSDHQRYSEKALDHLYKLIAQRDIDELWAERPKAAARKKQGARR
jgi:hypothetical protein